MSRQNDDVALFEVGRVFVRSGAETGAPKEERRLAIALTGARALSFWSGGERDANFDAMDLKGIVEDVLEHFALRGVQFSKRTESTALFLESAGIALGDQIVAYVMQNATRFGIQDAIWRGVYYTPNGGARSGGYGHFDHVHVTTTGGGYPTGAEVYYR